MSGWNAEYGGLRRTDSRRVAAASCRIVCASQFGDVAGGVFDDLRACNKVSVSKPYLPSRCQPEKLFWRIFAKVLLLDIKYAAEGHLESSCVCVFRLVDRS